MRLKLIQYNVRHWTNGRHLTENWILNAERPDVILLNETSIINSQMIKIVGYHSYTSTQGPHYGSAILIKRNITHTKIDTHLDSFLAIKIQTQAGPIIISTTYSPLAKI